MFDGLLIASLLGAIVDGIKTAFVPTIPAENWANKELYYKDLMDGVSAEQRMKNAKNGKYKLTETYPEPHRTHPEPHRTEDGKIFIENCKLYDEDLREYGTQQTYEWVRQGKYNLTPKELEKELERIKKEFGFEY